MCDVFFRKMWSKIQKEFSSGYPHQLQFFFEGKTHTKTTNKLLWIPGHRWFLEDISWLTTATFSETIKRRICSSIRSFTRLNVFFVEENCRTRGINHHKNKTTLKGWNKKILFFLIDVQFLEGLFSPCADSFFSMVSPLKDCYVWIPLKVQGCWKIVFWWLQVHKHTYISYMYVQIIQMLNQCNRIELSHMSTWNFAPTETFTILDQAPPKRPCFL